MPSVENERMMALVRPDSERRRVGYTTTLLMDPEIFSIVLLKLQKLTNTHLKKNYSPLKGFSIKKKIAVNSMGLGEIELGFYGDFPSALVYHFLRDELITVMDGRLFYRGIDPQYKLDKTNA